MKKAFMLLLLLALCLSLCSCAAENTSGKSETASPATAHYISLTPDNIGDYIHISGHYTESKYQKTLFYYTSSSVIDFQACSTANGSFENVEVTIRADIDGKDTSGRNWHLADSKAKDVTFSFKMPATGNYSCSYVIECERITQVLTGSCQFTILSVSGFFVPEA